MAEERVQRRLAAILARALRDHPDLTHEDILACLRLAADDKSG